MSQKKSYLFCGVVSRAAPGGLSCATMSHILRAGSKSWHMKGLHVLNKCPLSVETSTFVALLNLLWFHDFNTDLHCPARQALQLPSLISFDFWTSLWFSWSINLTGTASRSQKCKKRTCSHISEHFIPTSEN